MSGQLGSPVRRGVALIEALVALALLAVSGVAVIGTVAQSARLAAAARSVELQVLESSHLMEATTLWSVRELDQRIGTRVQGPFLMRIDRPVASLYLVSISDSTSGEVLVRTSLHRTERQ